MAKTAISEEIQSLAHQLALIGEEVAAAEGWGRREELITAASIRALLRARRRRDVQFPPGLFADPAWDMLLELSAARLEERPIAVSDLCLSAAVPQTTALRWIRVLEEQRLIEKVSDPTDGRRIFVHLTDDAAAKMVSALTATPIAPL